jgi:hypothetical protein
MATLSPFPCNLRDSNFLNIRNLKHYVPLTRENVDYRQVDACVRAACVCQILDSIVQDSRIKRGDLAGIYADFSIEVNSLSSPEF